MCRPGGPGEGYYAGYINFSTKYHSAQHVISSYRSKGVNNGQFDALVPALNDYATTSTGSVAGLEGFCAAWEAAATANPTAFLDAQISVVDELFGAAARVLAEARNIQFGLTRAVLLDIAIVNGAGEGPSSIREIVRRTDAASALVDNNISGVKIKVDGKDVDEAHWLQTLLTEWVRVNPAAWSHVNVFQALLADRRYSFNSGLPFTVNGSGGPATIDCQVIVASGRRR
ncbi:hypothetical protein H4R21_003343 [Coemansia helicoidea]|uniref:Uncharacterized protein n=1 Tax=Coemansia helicoidea TaxID=1286919 RepID=A0ACC1L3Y1_9FUNG|nr:hypothetical protein H4R21_003343 [Coemansia helicoidea]